MKTGRRRKTARGSKRGRKRYASYMRSGRRRKTGRVARGAGKKNRQAPQSVFGRAGLSFFAHVRENLPFYFVFCLCFVYAIQLGVLERTFSFQATAQQTLAFDGCDGVSYLLRAYAKGNEFLLSVPLSERSEASASFFGSGRVESVSFTSKEKVKVERLLINEYEVCAPCLEGKRYLVASNRTGTLAVLLEASGQEEAGEERASKSAFRLQGIIGGERKLRYAEIEDPVLFSVGGSWRARENAAMPSSFYGVDAPFHIYRIGVLAESLRTGVWPQSYYSFVSLLPPALLSLAGVSQEYAYKVYEIFLFFLPVVIFALYARKLRFQQAGAFLFASLLYLYMPPLGYPTGGGQDLFIYGMTAHTLATYLSLFFFFFAYEATVEGRRGAFLPAVALFFLAFLANQRIALALAAMLGVLTVAAFIKSKNALWLAAACAASVLWVAIPFFQTGIFEKYSPLGGGRIEGWGDGAVSFVQAGNIILPLLVLAGMYAAFARREEIVWWLGACALIVFLVAMNPALNSAFPFIDGIRHMPSFYLPALFVGGIGACFLWRAGVEAVVRFAEKRKIDRATVGGAVAFGFLPVLAVVFLAVVISTSAYYARGGGSLEMAREYIGLENAYRVVGNRTVLFLSHGDLSHMPIYWKYLGSTILFGYEEEGTGGLKDKMEALGARYVIVGNALALDRYEPSLRQLRWRQYKQLQKDGSFSEIRTLGSNKAFELKGGEGAPGKAGLAGATEGWAADPALALACLGVVLILFLAEGHFEGKKARQRF
ncbi:MAG: hypothetical protein N3E51_00525 [Candidatus Micrarchaeota archaeon]|nr:hypothetical protein [Candidatus Micrarchaeota archaeon]